MEISDIDIKRNAKVTVGELRLLRESVGWGLEKNKERFRIGMENDYAHYSIKKGGMLIAFARVISDGAVYAFVVDFNIHPDYQRMGIGKKMLQRIAKDMKDDNIRMLQLTFKGNGLEEFYRKCGLEIISAGSLQFYKD